VTDTKYNVFYAYLKLHQNFDLCVTTASLPFKWLTTPKCKSTTFETEQCTVMTEQCSCDFSNDNVFK